MRKDLAEVEQQNGVLEKHIDALRNSTEHLQLENDFYREQNERMRRYVDAMRHAYLNGFGGKKLPDGDGERACEENLDDFVRKLIEFAKKQGRADCPPSQNEFDFYAHIKHVISNIKLDN